MREDVFNALESARTSGAWRSKSTLYPERDEGVIPNVSFERVRLVLMAVIRDLPFDMTIRELMEELEG